MLLTYAIKGLLMKKVILLSFIFWMGFFPAALIAETQLLDQVVAVVNEEPITQSELDILLRPIYDTYKKEYQGQDLFRKLTDARRKLLSQLIEDRLVYQEAKKLNIEVDEPDIERRIEKFKSRFKNTQEMEELLKHQGMSLNFIRDRFRRQAMIERLQDQEVRAKVVVSPVEIESYYNEHPDEFSQSDSIKLRTITLKKNDEAKEKGIKDEEAWRKIEAIHKKVLGGASFADLAKQDSEDSHALEGGLAGWIEKGDMIPEIDQVIFSQKPGTISEMIETQMGYHLFWVEEKKPGHRRTLEEVRDEIHTRLYREKSETRFDEWLKELKQTAYISIR